MSRSAISLKPELLSGLGLPMKDLLQRQISTVKRHVTLKLADESATDYVPSEWLANPPLNIELRTLHLDRFGCTWICRTLR